jgi:hypothetical protein
MMVVIGDRPSLERQLGGSTDLAKRRAEGLPDPDWVSTRDAYNDSTVAAGPGGVPQAVREGSPFAQDTGSLGAGGASGSGSGAGSASTTSAVDAFVNWLVESGDRENRGYIADMDRRPRQKGAGGAPSAESHPILGSLPIVGLAVSVPSDTSSAPADVVSMAASISGLKVLPPLTFGTTAATVALRGPAATRTLAQQIANAARFPMNFKRTVTVLETQEGPTLVAGGASDLSAEQIELAERLGLTPAPPMAGFHAEPTAIFGAGELGLTPVRGATSNIICLGCQADTIEALGGQVTSDYTYEF